MSKKTENKKEIELKEDFDIFEWVKKIDEKIEEIERKIVNLDYIK